VAIHERPGAQFLRIVGFFSGHSLSIRDGGPTFELQGGRSFGFEGAEALTSFRFSISTLWTRPTRINPFLEFEQNEKLLHGQPFQ
jgi:hypothetical protein